MKSAIHLFTRDFTLVAIGQIISLFGNQILRYALPLYLLNQTGSSALFGTVSASAFLPMLLLFPIGGMIADRSNKKYIMVCLDFFTSALVLLFCMCMNFMSIVIGMTVTIMILYAIQGIYQPTVHASIPLLVTQPHMMQANSIIDVISSSANMLGPVLGGILYSLFGLYPILILSMICFFLSAIMELFLHIPYCKQEHKESMRSIAKQDIQKSFDFIFHKQPLLWNIAIIYGLTAMLLCSLVVIGVPVIITQHLGLSTMVSNRLYGFAQGFIAIGSMSGGILAGVFSKKLQPTSIPYFMLGSAICMGIAGLGLAFLHDNMQIYVLLVLCCGVLLTLSSIFQIQMMTYVQLLTPSAQIGKVISCVICVCMCANPIGSFVYGMIFEHVTVAYYLPFYIAPVLVIALIFMSHKLFGEIADTLWESQEKSTC